MLESGSEYHCLAAVRRKQPDGRRTSVVVIRRAGTLIVVSGCSPRRAGRHYASRRKRPDGRMWSCVDPEGRSARSLAAGLPRRTAPQG